MAYIEKLDGCAKKRYFQKLLTCDGVDPYSLPDRSWSTDPQHLPPCTYADIVNYFVYGISAYTFEEFKAYKSLGAYKTFVAGWVQKVATYRPGGSTNVIVAAKVLHSQRLNEKPLAVWMVSAADGSILTGHCTCMAGLGESCSHICALSFAIDAMNRARETPTCTGVPAYWKVPLGVKGVTPRPASEIDFSSAQARKKNLDTFLVSDSQQSAAARSLSKMPDVSEPSATEVTDLMRGLKLGGSKSSVLKVRPEYCREFAVQNPSISSSPENAMPCQSLPEDLRNLREEEVVGKPLKFLQEYCRSMTVKVTQKECDAIEAHTRPQTSSGQWFSSRAGRLTASNMHLICHTNQNSPAPSLIKKICYPEKCVFYSAATKWGELHESDGRDGYTAYRKGQGHTNLEVRECGLYVSPEYPFMGASPDGIVHCDCGSCKDLVCLEVKCPYKHAEHTIAEAVCDDKDFCLGIDEASGKPFLKHDHPYHYQVQTHLLLTKAACCDFVVWTTVDLAVCRIFPDQKVLDDCVSKCSRLFRLAVLPELVGAWLEHGGNASSKKKRKHEETVPDADQSDSDSSDGSDDFCCSCQQPAHGRMVVCDNVECQIKLFHYQCVGLKRKPRGQWFCPECAPAPNSVGSNKSKKKKKH